MVVATPIREVGVGKEVETETGGNNMFFCSATSNIA
jgi:hypothetical protein